MQRRIVSVGWIIRLIIHTVIGDSCSCLVRNVTHPRRIAAIVGCWCRGWFGRWRRSGARAGTWSRRRRWCRRRTAEWHVREVLEHHFLRQTACRGLAAKLPEVDDEKLRLLRDALLRGIACRAKVLQVVGLGWVRGIGWI